MIRKQIIKNLQAVVMELGVQDVSATLDRPADSSHGDYSTNIALVLSKQLKKNPRELAEEIITLLNTKYQILDTVDRVDMAGPGFINFWIAQKALLENIQKMLGDEKITSSEKFQNKQVTVEFTDPNPFKEFHIGHLYSNIVGESISRILEANGAIVRRVCYQGDVGLHVAKSLWGLQKLMQEEQLSLDALSKKLLEERIKVLGKAYAKGATAYEEDEIAKEEMKTLNKKVFEKDTSIKELYETGREWSLEYFETIYTRLGTRFEGYYFESVVGETGKKLVEEYLEKGVFEKSEGAIIFPGEKYGLHSRVFINSLGLPTYEAKELGLAPTKYNDHPYDLSIIVTGNEINEYFKVLLVALKQINPELAEKTKHLSHGMVKLPEGKMSSRTGNVITGEWLLNEARERAAKKMQEVKKSEKLDLESSIDAISELIGIGAVKYALLKSSIGRDVEFNFDESISFEGNSGPYLQYTYVRTQSVLAKAGVEVKIESNNRKLEAEEESLLRKLYSFDEVVQAAAENFAPNVLATYLYEFASEFNLFYQKLPILKANEEERAFRIALTAATGNVIKQGLHLLGIKAPEKM